MFTIVRLERVGVSLCCGDLTCSLGALSAYRRAALARNGVSIHQNYLSMKISIRLHRAGHSSLSLSLFRSQSTNGATGAAEDWHRGSLSLSPPRFRAIARGRRHWEREHTKGKQGRKKKETTTTTTRKPQNASWL